MDKVPITINQYVNNLKDIISIESTFDQIGGH